MKYLGVRRMRFIVAFIAGGVSVVATLAGCATGVRPADFQSHISMLASDSMTGRGIGTPGIDLAAGYIAGQFSSLGIEPGGKDGSYFQVFEVTTGNQLIDQEQFTISGADVSPVRKVDYIPFFFSSNDEFDGDVVFVGYGVINEEKEHNDYRDLDVTGKVVLMLRREPPEWSEGGSATRHAFFRSKVYTARELGAAAVLIVNRLEKDDEDELMPFRASGGSYGLPVFHIKQALAESLLKAGGLDSLAKLQERGDAGEFASAPLDGVELKGRAGVEAKTTEARNVIGLIRGQGSAADEYVVIGGHYDHLGRATPRSIFRRAGGSSGEPQIHNGADDNASGTAGVIEAGRMLMRAKPLKRSVLLVTFTGEETGLHGSRHFVEDPPVPLDRIVAMLNMDMIGRFDDEKNTLQVFGTEAAEEFEEMVTRLTKAAGMKLRGDASALGPSDHTSFYQKKIPAIHLFTGLHEDYHRPSDDTEKINAVGGARVTDLVVAMAGEIIAADSRPRYHEVKARASILGRSGSGRPRVVMGIMPAYADSGDERGMGLDGVYQEGPAGTAGMKEGDRIIKIGQSPVNNIQDYMAALRNNKPGDEVQVVVLREGTQVQLKVKLAGR